MTLYEALMLWLILNELAVIAGIERAHRRGRS